MSRIEQAASLDRIVWAPIGNRYVELVLALVLLAAAILKTHQLFSNPAATFPGTVHSKAVLICLIESELLLAIWLLIGGLDRSRLICTATCLCIFAAVATYEALHSARSCGCFGNVKVSPIITATFDISAVIALWLTRAALSRVERPTETPPSRRRITIGASLALLGTVALWTANFVHHHPIGNRQLAIGNDQPQLIVLTPTDWLHKPFPLFDDIDNSAPMRHGRWLILLYHHDCDSCVQAIPNYQRLTTADPTQPRIAFIAMPPAASPAQDPVANSSRYLHLLLKPTHEWFASTPVVAALSDGQVIAALDGEPAVHPPDIAAWHD